jgi:hypothetical protein
MATYAAGEQYREFLARRIPVHRAHGLGANAAMIEAAKEVRLARRTLFLGLMNCAVVQEPGVPLPIWVPGAPQAKAASGERWPQGAEESAARYSSGLVFGATGVVCRCDSRDSCDRHEH